jgi:hypothetical protein
MGERVERLTVVVDGGGDTDQQDIARLTDRLRSQLLQLEVRDVAPIRSGEIPTHAKAGDVTLIGALAISMAPTVLPAAVDLIGSWFQHAPVRSVEVTIGEDSLKLTGASKEDQRRLMEAFLDRHAEQ